MYSGLRSAKCPGARLAWCHFNFVFLVAQFKAELHKIVCHYERRMSFMLRESREQDSREIRQLSCFTVGKKKTGIDQEATKLFSFSQRSTPTKVGVPVFFTQFWTWSMLTLTNGKNIFIVAVLSQAATIWFPQCFYFWTNVFKLTLTWQQILLHPVCFCILGY